MSQSIRILKSKLFIPRSSDTIRRERLYPLLDQITKKRLTTVLAGAGYGKTTLIAQAVTYLGLDTVWYHLEKSDKDFIAFLSYLVVGIRSVFPEFGIETFRRIKEVQCLSQEREVVLTIFLSEIENIIKKDLIIVLDDYHIIQDSQEINKSIEFLLKHFPTSIHLIIISRNDVDLFLSRLRAMREVMDITEDDLAFTTAEIEQLYLELFDISLNHGTTEMLHQKTDGWVSGLILFYHSLRGNKSQGIEKLLIKLKGSHKLIFSYLEENVYAMMTDKQKKFLIKTSILSRVNVNFCDKFLNISNSMDILKNLEDNHLFTFSFNEEKQWYYYHHLFQNFLHAKLNQELGVKDVLKLHKDAAILLENKGEDEEALRHYLIAEQVEQACRVLSRIGRQLVREGRLQLIDSYLTKIPDSYLNNEPWIQYIRAQLLQISGKSSEAIKGYKKALKFFRRQKSAEGIAMCLMDLGLNYFLTGDFQRAEMRLKELLKQNKLKPYLCIETLGYLIFISSYLGKLTIADNYFNEAMSLLPDDDRFRNGNRAWLYLVQGWRYLFSGDFNRALELGEQTKEIIENTGYHRLLALCYQLISTSCFYLGLFSMGMENARKGLGIVKERGLHDSNLAWLLFCSALNSIGLENITRAIIDAKESLKCFQDQTSPWGQAYAYLVLHLAYMKSGNILAAEESARTGIEMIKGLKLPQILGELKGNLATCLIERGQLEEALPFLKDAEKKLSHLKRHDSWLSRLFARFYWKQKQKKLALNKLLSGLKLCEANHYDIWVVAEKHWIMPLLIEIFAQGKMQGYIQKIFKKIGPCAREQLMLLKKDNNPLINKAASHLLNEIPKTPPPGLKVHLLGRFRLFIGDEAIPAKRWKSKKAKMLFKFLLYARSRGYLRKEVLMEFLWPEGDPEKTAKRLHVALASLRKTLEPEILKGTPSSYIMSDGDSYKLYIGDRGWVDTEKFTGELKTAKEENNPEISIVHYLNAESIYQGDFLEEDLYVEWCTEARQSFQEEYLYLITKIIKYYESREDYIRCIDYAAKYLKVDKYAENIYQLLMRYYSQIGNNVMVTRIFERCKENIMKKLNCPLSRETLTLYQELVSI